MSSVRIIFAGGGTGGHLIPALAIADRLMTKLQPDHTADFMFVGTKRGLEYRMKERLGYPLQLINVRGMARSLAFSNLLVPFLLIGAVLKSMMFMTRFQPAVVIGTGGYVMGPVMIAAIILRRPRVIQEQNSYPGVTTRQLASKVDRVFLGFGEARNYLSEKSHCIETGNPVKEIIGKVSRQDARAFYSIDEKSKVILILGGSQGASAVNKNIIRNLSNLPEDFEIIWQTGERDYKEVAAQAGGKVKSRSLFAFTDRIELAYAAADMVIARAGALTLAEITAAGLPSILIPYPFAAGDHQRKNAASFVQRGAALQFDDSGLDNVNLLGEAVKLFANGSREKMASAIGVIRNSQVKPAADFIAEEILRLIHLERSAA